MIRVVIDKQGRVLDISHEGRHLPAVVNAEIKASADRRTNLTLTFARFEVEVEER